jgi:teichoic acid transport system permease protein
MEMNSVTEPLAERQTFRKTAILVWALARNDFRSRFAGSYFGVLWAFAHPTATILLFWFVFQVGLRAAPTSDGVPYGLWLAAGLTPWFFFAEAWALSTTALMEYSYLVKKMVFRVELLPVIKVATALLFHLAFVVVVLILCLLVGRRPTWHLLQLPYYTFCLFALVMALGIATGSILPFFRDLNQLLTIVLQFGMWLTPIMWSVAMVPKQYQWLFKFNPVGYVVEGYRDALFGEAWIWEHWATTSGFWVLTLMLSLLARLVFRKLRPHFADVL